MSTVETLFGAWECDQPGCPSEFSITRWLRASDEGSEIQEAELLEWAKLLGWKVVDGKCFCPDCSNLRPVR